MSKQAENTTLDTLTDRLSTAGREVYLASLGAVATVEEESERLAADSRKRLDELQREASKLFDDLVKRGRTVEADARERLDAQARALKADVREAREKLGQRREQVTDAAADAERSLTATVEAVLDRLDLPARAEVKDLSKKIDALARRVAELTRLLEAPAPSAVLHVVPQEEGWAVKREGEAEPLVEATTKADVLDKARTLAEAAAPSRLVIHRKDGTIQDQSVIDG